MVVHYLNAYNFNEEAALNAILTSPPPANNAAAAGPQQSAPAASAGGGGGLFSKVWGKKST